MQPPGHLKINPPMLCQPQRMCVHVLGRDRAPPQHQRSPLTHTTCNNNFTATCDVAVTAGDYHDGAHAHELMTIHHSTAGPGSTFMLYCLSIPTSRPVTYVSHQPATNRPACPARDLTALLLLKEPWAFISLQQNGCSTLGPRVCQRASGLSAHCGTHSVPDHDLLRPQGTPSRQPAP